MLAQSFMWPITARQMQETHHFPAKWPGLGARARRMTMGICAHTRGPSEERALVCRAAEGGLRVTLRGVQTCAKERFHGCILQSEWVCIDVMRRTHQSILVRLISTVPHDIFAHVLKCAAVSQQRFGVFLMLSCTAVSL